MRTYHSTLGPPWYRSAGRRFRSADPEGAWLVINCLSIGPASRSRHRGIWLNWLRLTTNWTSLTSAAPSMADRHIACARPGVIARSASGPAILIARNSAGRLLAATESMIGKGVPKRQDRPGRTPCCLIRRPRGGRC